MGLRIDELDPYGSVDSVKSEDDLFEVSKNSGTPGFPVYASGDSRKITRKELLSLLGGIPYSGDRYEVVKVSNDGVQNGINFANAHTKASAKASSPYNKSIVYVWAGYYDMQESIYLSDNVSIIGIGNPEDVYFDSNYGLNSIFIASGTVNYALKNITIANNGNPTGLCIEHTSGQDYGQWDNVIISSATGLLSWMGQYNKITATVDNVLMGSLMDSCTVSNSVFKNKSCGYSETGACDINGIVKDSIGLDFCFGVSLVDRARIKGSIIRTTARDKSFAYTQSSTGSNGEISGIVDNCTGRDYCFASCSNAGGYGVVSGKVKGGTTARSYSFAYSPNEVRGYITGEVNTAVATGPDSIGFTKANGAIKNFSGINSRGLHLGTIERCTFINPAGNLKYGISIGEGSVVCYTKVIQLEPTTDGLKINASSQVKVTLCESNKDFNLISGESYTNIIPLPRNVIWTEQGEILTSPDGHRWRVTVDNSGIINTEDLG